MSKTSGSTMVRIFGGGDSELRKLGWSLLKDEVALSARLVDGAELLLDPKGKEKINHGSRTLVLICPEHALDRLFNAIPSGLEATATPIVRSL